MKKTLAALALTLFTLLGIAPAAMAATPPTDIVVEDKAGVLYQPQLLPALEKINFREPTKLAIVTIDGEPGTDQLNEDVLTLARADHPEWISSDGQKWADGLFIVAVDPIARKIGTYMGEDRKVSLEKQNSIQQAGADLFREAQWTSGTIAVAKKGASLINQPWYQSAAFIITTSVVGGLAAIGFGSWGLVRANNRRKAAENMVRGDAGFSSVSLDLPVTELNAKTIPESSTYGALVLRKYRTFSTSYADAVKLNDRSHAFTKKELSKAANVKVTAEYADIAVQLDALDDVIADTNTLLNRYSGWEGAWDRQAKPMQDDLDQLPALISQKEARDLPTIAALSSLHIQQTQELQLLAAGFASETVTPEAALDQLHAMRTALTEVLQMHSEAMITKVAKTKAEEKAMRDAMLRVRRDDMPTRQSTILGSVYGWSTFYSVTSFSSGYTAARQSLATSRSSSSGSSTGYGSSGGSFSGSGSSSSF